MLKHFRQDYGAVHTRRPYRRRVIRAQQQYIAQLNGSPDLGLQAINVDNLFCLNAVLPSACADDSVNLWPPR
jgi:hypothetical protein